MYVFTQMQKILHAEGRPNIACPDPRQTHMEMQQMQVDYYMPKVPKGQY